MSTNQASRDSLQSAAKASEAVRLGAELERLEQALHADPDNADLHRRYGKMLARSERYEEALACWYRVEEIEPEDAEPAKMIARLIIAKTRRRASHPEEFDQTPTAERKAAARREKGKARDAGLSNLYRSPKPKEPPKRREIKLTEWQKLERELDENPTNVPLCLQVVEHYLHDGNDFHAERLLSKSLTATDGDAQLRECWEEIQLRRAQRKLEAAQRRAAVEDTPGAKEALAQAQHDHHELEVDIYRSRCERRPDDPALKYELGLRLKQAGNYEEALQRLEEALDDPDRTAAVHLAIGECLQQLKKYPDALQHYRQAVERASELDQLECKKLALYRAGLLAAAIKLAELAKKYLGELVALDAHYKDAAARLAEIE